MSAPSNSFNYAGIGLRSETTDKPVKPTTFIKYSKHDSNLKEETSEDSANIGGSTTTIGYDRTDFTSAPEITDKLRFKEGLELFCYAALGGDVAGTADGDPVSDTKDGSTYNIQRYKYVWQPSSSRESLPMLTELKGFNMWTTPTATQRSLHPKIIDHLKVDEMEIKLEAKGDLTIKPKFKGDAPIYNTAAADQSKTFLPKSRNVKADNVTVYYGSQDAEGTTDAEIKANLVSSSCVQEITIKLNNNLSDSECFNEEFGMNTSDEGNFECTVSGKFELNRATALEEAAWVTGRTDGIWASSDPYIRQIIVELAGIPILKNDGTPSGLYYQMDMRFPRLSIDKWEPSEDGDDAATVEFEGKAILSTGATDGNVQNAPCIFTCYTDMEHLPTPEYLMSAAGGSKTEDDVYFTVKARGSYADEETVSDTST